MLHHEDEESIVIDESDLSQLDLDGLDGLDAEDWAAILGQDADGVGGRGTRDGIKLKRSRKRSLEANAWCHFVQRTPLPLRKPGHSHQYVDTVDENKPKARGRHAGRPEPEPRKNNRSQRPYHEERFSYVALYKEKTTETQKVVAAAAAGKGLAKEEDTLSEGGHYTQHEEGGEEGEGFAEESWSRVIRAPLRRKGHVTVDVCTATAGSDGESAALRRVVLSKGKLNKVIPGLYRVGRKLPWGGVWPSPWPPTRTEEAAPAEKQGVE
jgi:ribosomal protein RSM22 (predicted rRNA methylase)